MALGPPSASEMVMVWGQTWKVCPGKFAPPLCDTLGQGVTQRAPLSFLGSLYTLTLYPACTPSPSTLPLYLIQLYIGDVLSGASAGSHSSSPRFQA